MLRDDREARSRTLLVRFPAGWARPETGSYEASEEVLILSGTLTMSGRTYEPGEWAFLPPGWLREGTWAKDGEVIALARFDGPPRWHKDRGARGGELRARLYPAGDTPTTLGGTR